MEIKLTISKEKKYLLACSFGPDSMALFDALYKNGYNFEVAHVNYHKRDVSNWEQEQLTKYCDERNIVIHILDTSKMDHEGNFQAWARNIRYDFFKSLVELNKLDSVLVAHNLDDLLETYIMQLRREARYSYYGIKEENIINGLKIVRPLLNYRKSFLKEYDEINDVPFSIDVSNLSNDYLRNRIRHSQVEKLSDEEALKLKEEVDEINEKITNNLNSLKNIEKMNKKEVQRISVELFSSFIDSSIYNLGVHTSVSNEQILELKQLSESNKSNIVVDLGNDIIYCQEYGDIMITTKQPGYSYQLEAPGSLKTAQFVIDFSNGAEDRNITDDSYPIKIRNYNPNDKYLIKDYEVKVSRLFLDWKMPVHLRSVWPVIEDKNGRIIYIPRYRKTFVDNHKSIFKINLK